MLHHIQPLQFLLTLLAGWIHRRQLDAIEYLKEENRLLKECLGERHIRFTDAERRRLARRAHALGRRALSDLDTLVTPDTLMRFGIERWSHRNGLTPIVAAPVGRARSMRSRNVQLYVQTTHERTV